MTSNHSDRSILGSKQPHISPSETVSVTRRQLLPPQAFKAANKLQAMSSHDGSWIVVNGGASDGSKIKESNEIEEIKREGAEDIPEDDDDGQFEEIEGAEDIPEDDDDGQFEETEGAEDVPAHNDDSLIPRTRHFNNCNVYMNSFNVRGVKVKNSGNNAPRVTPSRMSCSLLQLLMRLSMTDPYLLLDYGDTAPNEGSPSSFKLPRRPSTRPKVSTRAPTTLPGHDSESHPHPINPFLPIQMSLRPNSLSHILQPFPDHDDAPHHNTENNWNDFKLPSSTNLHAHHYPVTTNSSRHRPDTDSKSLEHHLDSSLKILTGIQSSGILADGITPQARDTLKAINALVFKKTLPHFKFVKNVVKPDWLQIP